MIYLTGIDNSQSDDTGNTKDQINYYVDIPASKYFSQDRGSLCTIQVVTGTYSSEPTNGSCAHYHLMSGTPNGFTVNNSLNIESSTPPLTVPDTACIAMAVEQNANTGGEIRGCGEFLMAARPERLHIKVVYTLVEADGSESYVSEPPAGTNHSLALKFTYYDAVQSTVNMKNHQDYRQLKGGRSSYI